MKEIYRIRMCRDDVDPQSPREWENLGTMYCRHRNLGDYEKFKHAKNWDTKDVLLDVMSDDELLPKDFKDTLTDADGFDLPDDEALTKVRTLFESLYVVLPLYLYDHSGITISTGAFSCRWDSGLVGIIFVSHKKAKEMFEIEEDGWTKEMNDRTVKSLIGEVEVYDQYLTGDMYGFQIEKLVYKFEQPNEEIDPTDDSLPWEHEDSCWSFYGSDLDGEKANGMLEHICHNPGDGRLKAAKEAMNDLGKWKLLPPYVQKEEHATA